MAFLGEGILTRLNETPHKNMVAFLDMLGIQLLPASAARVPVTFKVAPGIQDPFLIPAFTQVTANPTGDRPEELPFETKSNLWAIPSVLEEFVAVNPEQDGIFRPPTEFLKSEKRVSPLPLYRIVSFSLSGSNAFQFEHVEGLKKDDILKVMPQGNGSPAYYVVRSIDGEIVTVTENFTQNYQAGTEVEKLTKFELFQGKSLQEHILYLGDPNIFNVKGKATFDLEIRLFSEGETLPLDVTWEYWGVTQTNKEDGWQTFEETIEIGRAHV
jgi:hypothetical protein